MKALDRKLLKKFLKLAADTLSGEWVLIGGTVLPLLGIDHRSTTDIDLIDRGKGGRGQAVQLMAIAESLGLPVETINQAGSLFLSKVPHSKKDLVLLCKGRKATIYRPGPTLYLLLKLKRLSESDLLDCREWLKYLKKEKEYFDSQIVSQAIDKELAASPSEEKTGRLQTLQSLIIRGS